MRKRLPDDKSGSQNRAAAARMDSSVANLVRDRARGRCEYCRLHQGDEPLLVFHVEHVIARQHGGSDDPSNLALACHHCNRHKGPNLAGIDPETGAITPLFHPRRDLWEEHFELRGVWIGGKTATGRASVQVLNMNASPRLDLRAELRTLGRLP